MQLQKILLQPERFEIPAGLAEAIKGPSSQSLNEWFPDVLFRVDLGGLGGYEYVSVRIDNERGHFSAACWHFLRGKWAKCGRVYQSAISPEALGAELRTADFEVVEPEQMDLRVGKQVLSFR